MGPDTDRANTDTWLRASKDKKVRAYIESYTPTLSIRESRSPGADLYDTLERVSVAFPLQNVVAPAPGLESELQAWDILSDEALREFELGLE